TGARPAKAYETASEQSTAHQARRLGHARVRAKAAVGHRSHSGTALAGYRIDRDSPACARFHNSVGAFCGYRAIVEGDSHHRWTAYLALPQVRQATPFQQEAQPVRGRA